MERGLFYNIIVEVANDSVGEDMCMKKNGFNGTWRKPEYKWVVIAVCFLMILVALGFCSSSKSLYLSAITKALGIKRSAFSISDSCRYITTAVVNLFFGVVLSKFGIKKMVAFGFLSLLTFAVISANATSVISFCVAGCFLGLGLSWTSTTMVGHVVNQWCKEKKGTIMGFVLAANGFGGALATIILSPFIEDSQNEFGYRNAYWLTAAILIIVGIVVTAILKENAAESGKVQVKKECKAESTSSGSKLRGMPFACAVICVFLSGLILQGMNGIAVSHMKDVGLDAGYVAAVFSLQSLLLAACKFLSGLVHDKIGIRKTMLICTMAAAIAPVLLICVTPNAQGEILAVIFCVCFAIALPLETVMLPLLAMDMFSGESYAKALGIFVSINTAGYAVGGPIVNLSYDICGDYKIALYTMAIVMLAVVLIYQYALKKANEASLTQQVK